MTSLGDLRRSTGAARTRPCQPRQAYIEACPFVGLLKDGDLGSAIHSRPAVRTAQSILPEKVSLRQQQNFFVVIACRSSRRFDRRVVVVVVVIGVITAASAYIQVVVVVLVHYKLVRACHNYPPDPIP
jgi:hypothetical protein